ncbi:hypothetical protein D9758_018675 [Tetrapyrgos nigripes]|uniref:Heterokaryon incompatibility domain-containing protein n=1 Tax=Tetrapyrgos nigripes TaxID=182062 RepID=A0A8H5EZJ3_9AGAR|nr:hypothetical protein D9758_018675 [Tetrapyrgos nigripes]
MTPFTKDQQIFFFSFPSIRIQYNSLNTLTRLLNTKTLRVQEFFTEIPRYAILSHTWEDEEVTFQDIQSVAALADTCSGRQLTFDDIRAFLPPAQLKKGYTKVVQACVRARSYAFDWIWIDSCCINKESSAELSEAINSMYQYYANAVVCYVYLFDVSGKLHPKDLASDFKKSRWFTRGWTLQELLAPEFISFFDKDWTKIGTRWSLRDIISVAYAVPNGPKIKSDTLVIFQCFSTLLQDFHALPTLLSVTCDKWICRDLSETTELFQSVELLA